MNLNYFLDILNTAGASVYIGIVIFIALVSWILLRMLRKRKLKANSVLTESDSNNTILEDEHNDETEDEGASSQIKIGAGLTYKCLCFRKIKGVPVADFTSINEPLGELYQFDPSCPVSGSGYIVRQLDNGEIVDYDPREVKMQVEETPDYAWHAINWKDDVNAFWTVPVQWWKHTANWYVAGVLGLVFFTILLVFG